MASVQINNNPVREFRPITDDDAPAPATLAVSMRVQLCEADLVAALFHATETCIPPDELDDADTVRFYVSDGLLNGGLERVSELRMRIADAAPHSADATWAHLCRRRVREVYGTAPATKTTKAGKRAAPARRALAPAA